MIKALFVLAALASTPACTINYQMPKPDPVPTAPVVASAAVPAVADTPVPGAPVIQPTTYQLEQAFAKIRALPPGKTLRLIALTIRKEIPMFEAGGESTAGMAYLASAIEVDDGSGCSAANLKTAARIAPVLDRLAEAPWTAANEIEVADTDQKAQTDVNLHFSADVLKALPGECAKPAAPTHKPAAAKLPRSKIRSL